MIFNTNGTLSCVVALLLLIKYFHSDLQEMLSLCGNEKRHCLV